MSEFYQESPQITNTFQSDLLLKSHLQKNLPQEIQKGRLEHLDHMGHLASTEMFKYAQDAEHNPPQHIPFDAWGKRIDKIKTSDRWKFMEKIAAEEGLIATAYDRRFGPFSRVYQMALLYLYAPSSAFFSCPLAMTDGTARSIELFGNDSLKKRALHHLLSREPKSFWTAGQWMTERTGGSDVSGTSTIAHPHSRNSIGEETYTLHGTKWFTSATTSQIALTLARSEGASQDSKGLQLFYLELRDSDGKLN